MTSPSAGAAVITGASSGIGEATAHHLHAASYKVALLARRRDHIDALAADLGAGALAIKADVTDRDSLVAATEQVKKDLGGADVLVNNAGVMLLGPFSANQREDYRQMIEVNLLGAITTTEVFLDQLTASGHADIINISSVAGRTARSGNDVAATGWGVNGWSEALRQELLPNVRVTLTEPGVVVTELPTHITHESAKTAVTEMYSKAEMTAEVITSAIGRPRHLAINEILLRPSTRTEPASYQAAVSNSMSC